MQTNIQNLTHELKSPITAIQGAAELISPNMPTADQARFLAQIKTQAKRVQTIIQNMLGLASLEHQQTLHLVVSVNLNELIQTQIDHLREKSNASRVNIHAACRASLIIEVDSFLLGQAIVNLLENALDFSPPNSTINVTVVEQNTEILISVLDQGAGVPDYALTKVFDKFYSLPRPASSLNAGQKSTGLGLNFVREVAKLHGGSVTLSNLADGGAMAVITLPM